MTTLSIDEDGTHADGRAPLDVPREIVPHEHALRWLTPERAHRMVEDGRRRLSIAHVSTQHYGIGGLGEP